METITVICNDNAGACNPLIYTVQISARAFHHSDPLEILAAVERERRKDIGNDIGMDIELLVAFAGDLSPCHDWRD